MQAGLKFSGCQRWQKPISEVVCVYTNKLNKSEKMKIVNVLYRMGLIGLMSWLGVLSADAVHEKPIVVIIPSYNNAQWYQRNLDSVFSQNYQNYRVVYIDDVSTDNTGQLVKSYIEQKGKEKRVDFIQNEKRVGALSNIFYAVWSCDPMEIVVSLDGDDWLANEEVLSKLNSTYADPEVWMTYGQFSCFPYVDGVGAAEVPFSVIASNSFRESPWVTTHLRTFYAGLFQKINLEDLLIDGNFFSMTWDMAMMFPMLEMAGDRSRFIPDVLYVYNIENPLNDGKVNRMYQAALEEMIRRKEKYLPILELQ